MTRRSTARFAGLGLLSVFVLAPVQSAVREQATTPIGFAGVLAASPDGTFLFSGTITDLASGEILAQPQLRFASGGNAELSIADGERTLKLVVAADRGKATATIGLLELLGGATVTLSRLELRLR